MGLAMQRTLWEKPSSPKGAVDAVLIANSYHEFTNPLAILDHTFRALRSDGRLLVLDREPRSPSHFLPYLKASSKMRKKY
jgi:ubiquinone/menaquinone biosynthesis C-methylase UbiE